QRLVDVLRLVLSKRQDAEQRLASRGTHRLAGQVLILPATATTMIRAAIRFATLGPASKQRRPNALEQQHSSTPRRLPTLLWADDHRTAVVERRQQATVVHPRALDDPVVVRSAEQLPAVEQQRLALIDTT